MKLNLGCSTDLRPDYINIDIYPPADELVDLSKAWPWSDSSVEYIRAHDIVEHLPSKILTMNEAWRVLRPGGKFEIFVPTTDGRGAFQDPTHVSFWTPNDLFYFTAGVPERERFGKSYGILARFRIVSQQHSEYSNKVWKLMAVLEAVKA